MTKAEMMLKMSRLAAELEAANETQFLSDEIIAEYRVTQAQRDTEIERLKAELAQARAEIATMQAELSALQPAIDPDVDAEVRAQFKALWDSCEAQSEPERCVRCNTPITRENYSRAIDRPGQWTGALCRSCDEQMDAAFDEHLGLADMSNRELALLADYAPQTPRMYKYFVPSCVYPPRRCRRRVFQYYSRLQQHRWMGGITHRELIALAKHEGLYATHRELARLRAYAADWDADVEQAENDSIPW